MFMKKLFTFKQLLLQSFIIVFLALGSYGQTIVNNGDYESWTAGNPDGWTTIESGIDVTQETTTIHGGSSSASVDVLTGSQGDTDFRQSVNVTAGTDYNVSVWIYHTEGFIKARLYVGGYQSYSDNTITGSWQEMTYVYSANTTGDIEIGLRFYDQSGFDGAEIVYVDDYVMTPIAAGNEETIYIEPFDTDLGATTQYSVLADQVWEFADFGNPAGCSKMSGYDGGAVINEDWLITNAINCSNHTNVTLSFDHARNYADNSGLSVLISTDYDGSSDPNGFTWTDISADFTWPTGGWSFIPAGTADINAYVGASTYIAYKYTCDDVAAATWEVDNIKVEGEFDVTTFIAGSFNGWSASDPAYEMEVNANGVFELTKSLGAATHEYKVVEDGNWYPNNNQQFTFTATEDVIWKYNYDANLVFHTKPVVAGNFLSAIGGNDWDPSELMGEMSDAEGDDIFTLELTIPQGSYECKVTLNHNWDQSTGGNVPFTTDGVNPTTFTYDFTTNTTTVSGPPPPAATVTFVVDDSEGMNYDGFYLKGSWDVNGNYDPAWNNGDEHSAFYDDGTNGDATADDHMWTCQQELVVDAGANTWEWGVNDTEHNWVAGNWQFTIPDDLPQTLTWVVPTTPLLVINEIMYNSPGADEEWVELYNSTDTEIDLEGWKLLDSDAGHTPIIITAGHSIAPDAYFTIMVATGGDFPFTPDFDGSGNFSLGNGGDVVRIYNADGILVDFVEYDDGGDWPSAPDGDGPTLALIDPETDNSLAESWAASNEDGGTPGAINFPPLPFINVTAPNGGEFVQQDSYFDITWNYGNWDGDIKIELFRDGQSPDLLVSGIPASDTVYNWYVFADLELGDDYKVLISGLDAETPYDESDDFFSIIEHYFIPNLVLTEIMYNPPESGDDTLEFVEIFNNGEDTVNLEGFYFSEGFEYTFLNTEILPDSFLLVSKDSVAMFNTFAVTALQWTSGGLKNSGEDIEIRDLYDNVVDYVDYDDALPWDTLADGFGPSLTLCNPDADNNIAENWTASVNFAAVNAAGDSIWATPGFGCQVSLFASFEADITFLSIGNGVMFTDLTVGEPTEWTWTFEGGTPDTWNGETPPEIIYNEVGLWDVTLFVSDGFNTDETTFEDYIEVVDFAPPTNLQAVVGPYDDVQLTWNAPGAGNTDELIYDNDVVTGAYSYEGYTMATHMSPDGPCKLLTLKYFTTIQEGDNTFNANVYNWLGAAPDTEVVYTEVATAEEDIWLEVDVSGQNINFTEDFVVGFGSFNATTFVGYDTDLNNGRSWDFDNDALWEPWTEAYLIRAVVEYENGTIAEIGNIGLDVKINLDRSTNSTHPTDYSDLTIVDPIDNMFGGARDLLGYNVYRDDVQINTAFVEVTEYNDPEPSIATHEYFVTAVYDGGESDPSNVVTVVVTDVLEVSTNTVSIYPNPNNGVFTIELQEDAVVEIYILDITGKEIYSNTLNRTEKINVLGMQKGLYLVRLHDKTSNELTIKKIIVQ